MHSELRFYILKGDCVKSGPGSLVSCKEMESHYGLRRLHLNTFGIFFSVLFVQLTWLHVPSSPYGNVSETLMGTLYSVEQQ